MKNYGIGAFLIILSFQVHAAHSPAGMVIVTAADSSYFRHVLNLIGSLHYSNFDSLQEICVYDLGLSPAQEAQLNAIEKVSVHLIQCTNPDMLKPMPVHPGGRAVPGLYSWKPVAIKDALDRFDAVLYLDAGMVVLKPLDKVFESIREQGYFFVGVPHSIAWCTTKLVKDAFQLDLPGRAFILDEQVNALGANLLGISRMYYESLVMPIYELAKNITYFIDDGTTPAGFGTGRHDQTLWSICARLLNCEIKSPGWCSLNIGGAEIPFHSHWSADCLNADTSIYHSRFDLYLEHSASRLGLPPFTGHGTGKPYFVDYIHYKSSKELV